MSLNIGTLVGYLQLDDTKFTAKADQADKKINGLKLHLEALGKTNPKLKLEVETQTKALDDLQARIAALRVESANGVDVRVAADQANIELDRLMTKVRAMHNAEIKVHVDDKEATAKLDALQKKTDGLKFNTGGALFSNIAAFGPAILPFINIVPGGLFAIGSGAVAAASGVGVLTLAFHGLGAAASAYNTYLNQLPFAKTAAQQAALKKTLSLSAYGDANAQGRTFARTLIDQGLPAGDRIKNAAQAGALPGMTKALTDLLPLVPSVSRLVKSLGETMGGLADKTAKALNSPFWRQWMQWLAKDAKVQIPLVGGIIGHFFTGLMQGIEQFSPQGTSLLTWLDNLMLKFQNWTGSPQFDKFMATTAADAKLVGDALVPLGHILGGIYQGLSATGNAELKVFGDLLSGIALMPTGGLKIIGATLPGIFIAMKGLALLNGAKSLVGGVGGLFGGLFGGKGGIGGIASKAAPVPVFVTNPGFSGGLPGVGGETPKGGVPPILAASPYLLPLLTSGDAGPAQQTAQSKRDQAAQQLLEVKNGFDSNHDSALAALIGKDPQQGLALLKQVSDIAGRTLPAELKYLSDAYPLTKKAVDNYNASVSNQAALTNFLLVPALGTAAAKTAALAANLDGLHSKDITVGLHIQAFGKQDILGTVTNMLGPASASGGTIPGQRAPYGDKLLVPLAPGEEVISNNHGQADRHRALLKAINAGMAGGGTVDPLAGFGPNSIPTKAGHGSKGSKSSAASKAAAARRHALQVQLAYYKAQLTATNAELSAAENWSQSFAGNAFSANLAPFEKAGPAVTSIVNGMKVTQSGTVDTSPGGILTAMLAYQKSQMTQAQNLASWVRKLRNEGVSKAVLAQMQAAGPQGIAQIQALASGTQAQVRQFNSLNVATTASLNETGALATNGANFSSLQKAQMTEQSTIKAIQRALNGGAPVKVQVVNGHLRP